MRACLLFTLPTFISAVGDALEKCSAGFEQVADIDTLILKLAQANATSKYCLLGQDGPSFGQDGFVDGLGPIANGNAYGTSGKYLDVLAGHVEMFWVQSHWTTAQGTTYDADRTKPMLRIQKGATVTGHHLSFNGGAGYWPAPAQVDIKTGGTFNCDECSFANWDGGYLQKSTGGKILNYREAMNNGDCTGGTMGNARECTGGTIEHANVRSGAVSQGVIMVETTMDANNTKVTKNIDSSFKCTKCTFSGGVSVTAKGCDIYQHYGTFETDAAKLTSAKYSAGSLDLTGSNAFVGAAGTSAKTPTCCTMYKDADEMASALAGKDMSSSDECVSASSSAARAFGVVGAVVTALVALLF